MDDIIVHYGEDGGFNPDETYIVGSSSDRSRVRLFDRLTGETRELLPTKAIALGEALILHANRIIDTPPVPNLPNNKRERR